jgi:Ca2+-binding RTX toxin-like protein
LNVKFSGGTLNVTDNIIVANGNAIYQSSDYNTDIFQISAQINGTGGSGLRLDGFGNQVNVASSGIVTGNIGVFLNNGSADTDLASAVTNNGTIDGTGNGIFNGDSGTVLGNSGTIHGDIAVESVHYGMSITNLGLGSIEGESTGIDLTGIEDGGQQTRITNYGAISGQVAIQGGDGEEIVINHGVIVGKVNLGGGNDTFDARGGQVNGEIDGGAGNDTYIVDTADADIHEAASSDLGDTVESIVSFTLGSNFEELILIGRAKTNGTGNDEGNIIHGNDANNKLNGLGGDDFIFGGRGNDVLTGGSGADTFQFNDSFGHDKIRDFQSGGPDHDFIDLSDVSAITSFSDLKKHHLEQVHGDLIIDAGHGDIVTLRHVSLHDVKAGDFLFDAA